MQPKIIILRGNSGSGKTTISKKLQKKLGYDRAICLAGRFIDLN